MHKQGFIDHIANQYGCTKKEAEKTIDMFTFSVIDCDEFILENKEEFLLFIKKIIGKEHRIFPMVFDNERFIGGYNETNHYVKDLLELDVFF